MLSVDNYNNTEIVQGGEDVARLPHTAQKRGGVIRTSPYFYNLKNIKGEQANEKTEEVKALGNCAFPQDQELSVLTIKVKFGDNSMAGKHENINGG